MQSEKTSFVLGKKNLMVVLGGFLVVVLGFILMSGGKAESPEVFVNEEIFSTRRITIAPIVVLIGFAIVGFGIMIKPEKTLVEGEVKNK